MKTSKMHESAVSKIKSQIERLKKDQKSFEKRIEEIKEEIVDKEAALKILNSKYTKIKKKETEMEKMENEYASIINNTLGKKKKDVLNEETDDLEVLDRSVSENVMDRLAGESYVD